MIIYNIIHHGKGFGIEVESFTSPDVAVSHAKDYLESISPGDWEEWTGNPKAFIFFAFYGESTIAVVKTELNEQVP